MFQVEIYFKDLPDVAKYCSAADEIFARYELPCVVGGANERVYVDNGDPKDFGRLYAAIGKISDISWIVKGIKDAYFNNGRSRDTLMTSFFKV